MRRIAFLAIILTAETLQAAAVQQDAAQIYAAAESFLRRESAGLPGRVSLEFGKFDARVSRPACAQLQAFFPAGSRAWGQTSVGVRCASPSWTLYLPARVRVSADYLIAARPLALGQEISAGDIAVQHGELTQLPAGVLTEASQAIGRRLSNGVQAGQPLRRDAVREPPAVVQGQPVALIVTGPGFKISSEGVALGKAPEGDRVQVRTGSGSVVSGIVRPGPVVEIVN